jgi:hypothetical protein
MTPPRQTDRAFGLTFAVVFAVVAAVAFFAFGLMLTWVVALAGAFLAVALTMPWILLPLNRFWAALAARLGHVNNYVLLGAFFFAFVLPIGFVMRLFGDPMRRAIDPAAESYWSPVGRKADIDTYRDLF